MHPSAPGGGRLGVVRVLVVEDEVRLAQALQRGLRAEGFGVDLAHNGTDGLHLAREGGYDAVVLDVMLPGLNGGGGGVFFFFFFFSFSRLALSLKHISQP